jgi:hypothetical protein
VAAAFGTARFDDRLHVHVRHLRGLIGDDDAGEQADGDVAAAALDRTNLDFERRVQRLAARFHEEADFAVADHLAVAVEQRDLELLHSEAAAGEAVGVDVLRDGEGVVGVLLVAKVAADDREHANPQRRRSFVAQEGHGVLTEAEADFGALVAVRVMTAPASGCAHGDQRET